AARASAQNELADLTKQISDAKLAVSGSQEEANAKTRDLQAVDAKLKDESDRAAALQGQIDAARRALAQAQTETAAAQKQFETLQGQINAAAAELNALHAQIRAAKPEANPPSGADTPP